MKSAIYHPLSFFAYTSLKQWCFRLLVASTLIASFSGCQTPGPQVSDGGGRWPGLLSENAVMRTQTIQTFRALPSLCRPASFRIGSTRTSVSSMRTTNDWLATRASQIYLLQRTPALQMPLWCSRRAPHSRRWQRIQRQTWRSRHHLGYRQNRLIR